MLFLLEWTLICVPQLLVHTLLADHILAVSLGMVLAALLLRLFTRPALDPCLLSSAFQDLK